MELIKVPTFQMKNKSVTFMLVFYVIALMCLCQDVSWKECLSTKNINY